MCKCIGVEFACVLFWNNACGIWETLTDEFTFDKSSDLRWNGKWLNN